MLIGSFLLMRPAFLFAQACTGSLSGSVPTNVGQPMIRVSRLLVGGREG